MASEGTDHRNYEPTTPRKHEGGALMASEHDDAPMSDWREQLRERVKEIRARKLADKRTPDAGGGVELSEAASAAKAEKLRVALEATPALDATPEAGVEPVRVETIEDNVSPSLPVDDAATADANPVAAPDDAFAAGEASEPAWMRTPSGQPETGERALADPEPAIDSSHTLDDADAVDLIGSIELAGPSDLGDFADTADAGEVSTSNDLADATGRENEPIPPDVVPMFQDDPTFFDDNPTLEFEGDVERAVDAAAVVPAERAAIESVDDSEGNASAPQMIDEFTVSDRVDDSNPTADETPAWARATTPYAPALLPEPELEPEVPTASPRSTTDFDAIPPELQNVDIPAWALPRRRVDGPETVTNASIASMQDTPALAAYEHEPSTGVDDGDLLGQASSPYQVADAGAAAGSEDLDQTEIEPWEPSIDIDVADPKPIHTVMNASDEDAPDTAPFDAPLSTVPSSVPEGDARSFPGLFGHSEATKPTLDDELVFGSEAPDEGDLALDDWVPAAKAKKPLFADEAVFGPLDLDDDTALGAASSPVADSSAYAAKGAPASLDSPAERPLAASDRPAERPLAEFGAADQVTEATSAGDPPTAAPPVSRGVTSPTLDPVTAPVADVSSAAASAPKLPDRLGFFGSLDDEIDAPDEPASALEWDSDSDEVADVPAAATPQAPVSDRIFSALADALVVAVIGLLLLIAGASAADRAVIPFATATPLPLAAAWLLFGLSYGVFFTGTCGQTLGKMAMRVRVIGDDDFRVGYVKAIKRTIGYTLATLPIGLGLLTALRDPDNRGMHDRWSGTKVVKA